MNNEIKEILEQAKELHYIDESWERCDLLLDYITNLQEENEKNKEYSDFYKDMSDKWKDMSDVLKKSCEDYKSRCEKAIEIIKKYSNYPTYYLTGNIVKDLLKLLQGDDKE